MSDDIQARLRRLGVVKGARNLKPAPPPRPAPSQPAVEPAPSDAADPDPAAAQPVEDLFPGGYLLENDWGACFVVDHVYPLSRQHGNDRLAALLAANEDGGAADAALICGDPRLAELDLSRFLFLDTETTGLAGSGTVAFMVGVAFFDEQALVVRQYFLRDYGDEAAMLVLLAELLEERDGLITFNGRSFDLPLLDGRYLMNRLDATGQILSEPHIDLLPPARRLWRSRIGSCSLQSLEGEILGLGRSQVDVPGWAIPQMYIDYLRSGDARELQRVFYHNQIDMLSMVTLAARILRQFGQPQSDDPPLDLYSLGRWQVALGLGEQAEANLKQAAEGDLPLALYHQVLGELGLLLKRSERRAEAVELWQQIAVTSFDDISAHVELAKHYEWHEKELIQAREWTRQALALCQSWPPAQAALVRDELAYRLARLERKLGQDGA